LNGVDEPFDNVNAGSVPVILYESLSFLLNENLRRN